VFWAADQTLDLRIPGGAGLALHVSTDRENWEAAATEPDGDDAILVIARDVERVWVATNPAEVPAPAPRTGHRPKEEAQAEEAEPQE
jgi:hypothetical protein